MIPFLSQSSLDAYVKQEYYDLFYTFEWASLDLTTRIHLLLLFFTFF